MPEYRSALRNPWWIPPFLGGVPEVEPRLVSLLGLVSLALFFEQYDNSMLTAALKFIADDLHLQESNLGGFLALIKLGAVPAFLLVPFADRIGRRRVFLVAVAGFSVGTIGTAFAQTAAQFVAAQMATRIFMVGASAVAVVIVTEEFPAAYRGWAIGMLGALSACGNGLGAGLFAAVERLPYGWRSLYAVGVVPLLLLPLLRRRVKETDRFHRHAASNPAATGFSGWLRPMISLARTHPARAFGLAVVGGLFATGEAAVYQFTGYFTLEVHHWSPGMFSLMFILGGAVGIIGNVVAGRLGDHIGRRRDRLLLPRPVPRLRLRVLQRPGLGPAAGVDRLRVLQHRRGRRRARLLDRAVSRPRTAARRRPGWRSCRRSAGPPAWRWSVRGPASRATSPA